MRMGSQPQSHWKSWPLPIATGGLLAWLIRRSTSANWPGLRSYRCCLLRSYAPAANISAWLYCWPDLLRCDAVVNNSCDLARHGLSCCISGTVLRCRRHFVYNSKHLGRGGRGQAPCGSGGWRQEGGGRKSGRGARERDYVRLGMAESARGDNVHGGLGDVGVGARVVSFRWIWMERSRREPAQCCAADSICQRDRRVRRVGPGVLRQLRALFHRPPIRAQAVPSRTPASAEWSSTSR